MKRQNDDPVCSVCLRPDYNLPICAVCYESACEDCVRLCEVHDELLCLECAVPITKHMDDSLERTAEGKPDYWLCKKQWAGEQRKAQEASEAA